MNVIIIRNANLSSNAGMLRVIDANIKNGYNPFILSRSRKKGKRSYTTTEMYNYQGTNLKDHIIHVSSKRAGGIKNLFPLIKYQYILLINLVKLRKEIDIVHAIDLDTGFISLLFSSVFKKKLIYHIADFYSESRPKIPKIAKKLLKNLNTSLSLDQKVL